MVYKSDADSYMKLMKALLKEGFHPVALDGPNSDAILLQAGVIAGLKVIMFI